MPLLNGFNTFKTSNYDYSPCFYDSGGQISDMR